MDILKQYSSSLLCYHDYRAGHLTDLSLNAKNGTGTAITFSGYGAQFNGSSSAISLGNIGSVKTIIYSFKPNNLSGTILELINNSVYSTYTTTVTGTGFTSPTIYNNGIETATVTNGDNVIAVTQSTAIAAASVNLGEGNGVYFNGSIGFFLAFSTVLTAMEIAKITSELQRMKWPTALIQKTTSVAFKSGFGIKQTSTVGGVVGQFIADTHLQVAEATGRWQVVTDTMNGSLIKVIKCTTAGRLYLDMRRYGTTAEAAYGKFEYSYNNAVGTTSIISFLSNLTTSWSGTNGYHVAWNNDGTYHFFKSSGGATSLFVSAPNAFTRGVWYRIRLTRTAGNVFTNYIRGGTQYPQFTSTFAGTTVNGSNPVTDSTHVVGNYMVFDMTVNSQLAIANVSGNNSVLKSNTV